MNDARTEVRPGVRAALWLLNMIFAAIVFSTGCHRTAPTPAPVTPATPAPAPSGRPQPRLPAIKLWLGAHEIIAEQAMTEQQIQTGMMFRTEMAENEGMLFIFGRPHRASFWMKNTLIPLSCAYIDPEGKILEIHDMQPLNEAPIEAASDRVQYVLEMKQGWFERNGVGVGTVVRTERGTFAQTYFGQP